MADLFWPGDDRAGDHFTSESFLWTMVDVEADWLGAPLEVPDHLEWLGTEAELGGNPVIGLVELLREQDERVHRGLTSQDVVDSALMRMAEDAVGSVRAHLHAVIARLADLAAEHRDTPMVARTLTQHAVPTTFGFRVTAWLTAVLDAHDDLARLRVPRQGGGAAGAPAALGGLGHPPSRGGPPWRTT